MMDDSLCQEIFSPTLDEKWKQNLFIVFVLEVGYRIRKW